MAGVLKGSHSFTCTPRVHPLTEWTIPAFAFPAEAGTHLQTPGDGRLSWPWCTLLKNAGYERLVTKRYKTSDTGSCWVTLRYRLRGFGSSSRRNPPSPILNDMAYITGYGYTAQSLTVLRDMCSYLNFARNITLDHCPNRLSVCWRLSIHYVKQ